MENGASEAVALCAAQDFTVLLAVDANRVSVLVDIVLMNAPYLMRPRIGFSLNTGISGRFA
jgi:hypothetical protein